VKIGIIGGSGLSDSELKKEAISINTPYGEPSSAYEIEELEDKKVLFLKRHGQGHSLPPHKINYRANVWGFKQLGVERLIGIFAVGCLDENIPPGSIVLPDQIIDLTQGMRKNTFYEDAKVVHIDFTEPFCNELREAFQKAAHMLNLRIISHGTYICVNGPRLETKAEIKFYRNIGADIIGMTLMPEASLAREVEICYGAVAVVSNYAAGITKNPLTVREVVETMKGSMDKLRELIKVALRYVPEKRQCVCKDALKNASF